MRAHAPKLRSRIAPRGRLGSFTSFRVAFPVALDAQKQPLKMDNSVSGSGAVLAQPRLRVRRALEKGLLTTSGGQGNVAAHRRREASRRGSRGDVLRRNLRRLSSIVSARRLAVWRVRAEAHLRSDVTRFSTARMISVTGDRVSWIALVAVVYARSGGSGAWVSAALVTQFATYAITAPWAGVLGDRFDRRVVMIASDLSSAAVFVAFAFEHSPLILVVLAGVGALAGAPFQPASSAFLVMLVPESERARATAARFSGAAAGVVLGGLVGGVVVAVFGGPAAFLFNAASFVLSATLVLSIRGTFRVSASRDAAHEGVWAGVRLIVRTPALRLVVAANGAALVGYGMINVAEYPLFAMLGSGAAGFGIATAGYGVGQFVGARVGRRAGGAAEKHRLVLGWLVGGAAIFMCGVVPSTVAVIAMFALAGVGASTAGVATNLIMQRHAPDPVRARVFGASSSVMIGAIGVAMIVGGAVIGVLGPVVLCVVCGAVTLLALIPSSRVPPRGRLPWRPEREQVGVRRRPSRNRWLLAA